MFSSSSRALCCPPGEQLIVRETRFNLDEAVRKSVADCRMMRLRESTAALRQL
ncbi:hypothetical protein F2Q69_00038762 [Brassica cretica]|uniref:Uncharacterized protein n=1 Tax=Brassica cretica TaxID=69181 RepID=A0A8S9SKC1_BRACR|nr:hypothetical protein F2Q69_00038762 [Brassica cretica]